MEIKLTYFTPTYNRATLLQKLYDSLKLQTNKNFIWLIIDDGSSDNTKEIVSNWINEKIITIQYVYKENGGKNTAIDLSNQICETDFIACVDSDDYLTNDCTDVLYRYFDTCLHNKECAGIVGRRAHYNGEPFNKSWAKEEENICFYDIPKIYNYTEDTFLIFKKDVINKYHFPKIPGERFITESVLYEQFLYDYNLLMIPECLYLAEYQEVGYTAQGIKLFFKNPKGYLYSLKQKLYIARKKKLGIITICYRVAMVYAWKNAVKIKDDFKFEYKIPLLYKLIGSVLQVVKVFKLHQN